ncbi:MAG TPA: hypothetical protein ENI89_09670 [Desulfobulbus sp.]|nr:hypothetical protein [Desulfobulbus sp.]
MLRQDGKISKEYTSVIGGFSVLLIVWLFAAIGIWAVAALTVSLYQAEWSVSMLAHQYLEATGMTAPVHTLVDYYSHIKGMEYLLCALFFIAFPLFHSYLNRKTEKVSTRH